MLAAKGGDRRGYEVKVTKKKTLYLYEEDVEGLVEFCQAYIAVRWKYARKKPWAFKRINEAKPMKIARE